MCVEALNIHQFYEYCNNYLPHQEEKNMYIMSGEVWNIHQFYEYCTNYLLHQEEENIYIMSGEVEIFTNSMNIATTIFHTRKK